MQLCTAAQKRLRIHCLSKKKNPHASFRIHEGRVSFTRGSTLIFLMVIRCMESKSCWTDIANGYIMIRVYVVIISPKVDGYEKPLDYDRNGGRRA
jgi:hypothetical protein